MSDDRTRVHRRALLLTAALMAVFVAATVLYARYGYAVVLKTFEANQTARAEEATGSRVAREYEDYLRVDPSSLMMRGLLINRLLEERRGADAVEVAQRGVEIASGEDKPIAELLLARAKLGNGDLDEAEEIYSKVLEELGESGEAHYGLAHIYAAKGEFENMRKEYASAPASGRSPDYDQRLNAAYREADLGYPNSYDDSHDAIFINALVHKERMGLIDSVLEQLVEVGDFSRAPSFLIFLRGVREEDARNAEEAKRFYRMAAEQRDPLAMAALERLGREGK